MYLSTSQEIMRQHREEIMHDAEAARLMWTLRTSSGVAFRPVWNPRWEISRYVGLIARRLSK